MPFYRDDISNEEAIAAYKREGSYRAAAEALDCSRKVIEDAVLGRRRDKSVRDGKRRKEIKWCSCCMCRPVANDLHFLCYTCYKYFANEYENTEEQRMPKRIKNKLLI